MKKKIKVVLCAAVPLTVLAAFLYSRRR